MKLKLILLNIILLWTYPLVIGKATYHPVHVSYTNVEYNPQTKEFKMLFKIFADDFDKILFQKYQVHLELQTGKKKAGYQDYITKYINEHFQLFADNKNITKNKLKFSHSELREKAIWLYYNCRYKGKPAQFKILNSLMTDLYRDQTNLLIFTYLDYQTAFNFSNAKTIEQLTL